MVVDEDLAGRVWTVLAGNGELREIKMFGGRCFMLNGNMVAGTSKRGLLGSRPQTFVDDLAQQIVVGPGQELHRGDELGPHPMHAAEHQGRAEAARARRLAVRERLA